MHLVDAPGVDRSLLLIAGLGIGAELGGQPGQSRSEGRGQGPGGPFQVLPGLGVAEDPAHRLGHLVPGADQGGEGVADLVFTRSPVVGHPSVGRLHPAPQVAEAGGHLVPGVLTGFRMTVMNVHLLDGTYELFRAHFGRQDTRTSSAGQDIRATMGIIDSTLLLLREPGVTHLGASFDTVIESFRNEMFLGYKSSAGVDPELLEQFPLAEEALEAIGVLVWRNIVFEADDTIAAAALKWVDEVDQVVICSPDKDLCQCVIGDKIVTYNRRERKIYNEDAVVEKFGIHPESIPDYLALRGDAADGVPGLPGWGEKSSAAVLSRYTRIEAIPPSADDWEVTVRGAAKLAATLAERRDDALFYRELTTLRLDAPVTESLDDLGWRGVPRTRFHAFCEKLGVDPETVNVHRWAEE